MSAVRLNLTRAQSRALALLLAFVALGALGAALALPLLRLHRHYDDAIAAASDRIVRERRLIGMAPALHAQLQQLHELMPAQYYLHERNPALASAEVQSVAKRLLDANGCKLSSMNVLPPKAEAPLTRVGINVQLSGTLQCLEPLLYGLESAKPYLFIDNFSVRTGTFFMFNKPEQTEASPTLQIQFDLSGYVAGRHQP